MLREKGNASKYRDILRAHWDGVARKADNWTSWGTYYHRRFEEIYSFLITSGQRVLEIGRATRELLAALRPSLGIGIDFSGEILRHATKLNHKIVDLPIRYRERTYGTINIQR